MTLTNIALITISGRINKITYPEDKSRIQIGISHGFYLKKEKKTEWQWFNFTFWGERVVERILNAFEEKQWVIAAGTLEYVGVSPSGEKANIYCNGHQIQPSGAIAKSENNSFNNSNEDAPWNESNNVQDFKTETTAAASKTNAFGF